jgi:hypothetical protein
MSIGELLMTPEGRVKAKVKDVLKAVGAYYVMPVTSGYGNSGAPDFLVCYGGRFVGIECKAGKGKPTGLQIKNLQSIEQSGGQSLIVNEFNVVHLVNLLQEGVSSYEKNIQQVQSLDSPMLRPKNAS